MGYIAGHPPPRMQLTLRIFFMYDDRRGEAVTYASIRLWRMEEARSLRPGTKYKTTGDIRASEKESYKVRYQGHGRVSVDVNVRASEKVLCMFV